MQAWRELSSDVSWMKFYVTNLDSQTKKRPTVRPILDVNAPLGRPFAPQQGNSESYPRFGWHPKSNIDGLRQCCSPWGAR